jgi:hypothetical protein
MVSQMPETLMMKDFMTGTASVDHQSGLSVMEDVEVISRSAKKSIELMRSKNVDAEILDDLEETLREIRSCIRSL